MVLQWSEERIFQSYRGVKSQEGADIARSMGKTAQPAAEGRNRKLPLEQFAGGLRPPAIMTAAWSLSNSSSCPTDYIGIRRIAVLQEKLWNKQEKERETAGKRKPGGNRTKLQIQRI